MPDEEIRIIVTSSYGAQTREPFVQLVIGDRKAVQIPAMAALDVAHNMAEAAEAALSDAFFMQYLQQRLGLDEGRAALALRDFRKLRDQWRKKHG